MKYNVYVENTSDLYMVSQIAVWAEEGFIRFPESTLMGFSLDNGYKASVKKNKVSFSIWVYKE